jgi:hypothetical protein
MDGEDRPSLGDRAQWRNSERWRQFHGDISMSLSQALAADQAGDIESAAAEYETIITTGDLSLQVLLNLAVLYWQATDIGLAAAKKLSHGFFQTAARRFPELLEQARQQFPDSTEAQFWEKYIAWADLGEKLDSDDARRMLREDPATLVPAMLLFALSGGKEAQTEAAELLHCCKQDGTTRARYIISVLEGVMKRASHAGYSPSRG